MELSTVVDLDKIEKLVYKQIKRGGSLLLFKIEHIQLTALYWAVCVLRLIDKEPKEELCTESIMSFIASCKNTDGGYGGGPGYSSHSLHTLSAIQLHVLCGFPIPEDSLAYLRSLFNDDGSVSGDVFGETDVRFVYSLVCSHYLANQIERLNKEKLISYLNRCLNVDGGYGSRPGAESHSGHIFCCVASYSMLSTVESHSTEAWLRNRISEGGITGRPNKEYDSCYGWWVLSSLKTMKRLEDKVKVEARKFLLSCYNEGFACFPGEEPDLFHTFFVLCGLSLIGEGVCDVDSRTCMPFKRKENRGGVDSSQ